MKTHVKTIYLASLSLLFALFLVACSGGSSATPALSGKVLDSVTGAPVSGITIDFLGRSTMSASDGTFAMDLGGGTQSGPFALRGTGYCPYYATPISMDTSKPVQMKIYAMPASTASYATCALKIVIKDSGGTEIPGSTPFGYFILNSAGGFSSSAGACSYATGGYTVNIPTFGSDCLVAVIAKPSGNPAFNAMTNRVDLSSATTVTVTQDSTPGHTTAVTVTGTAGNKVQAMLSSPYGVFTATETLALPLGSALNVTNPYGYSCVWSQMQTEDNYLGVTDVTKSIVSIASPAPLSSSVTLPSVNSSLGPNAVPDKNTIAYSGGTLTVGAVSGASAYQFTITDATLGSIKVTSDSASVALPSWLASQLSGHTDNVSVIAVDFDMTFDISIIAAVFAAHGGMPAINIQEGLVMGNAGALSIDIAF